MGVHKRRAPVVSLVAALAVLPLAAARRQLRESDVAYGLDAFNARFRTRASHHFANDASRFHRRLFEHEEGLTDETLSTYMVSLHQPAGALTPALHRSLEERASLAIAGVVGGDLLMHGGRREADRLREQPEVRSVVPLLPELKVTPHFDQLIPSANHSAAAKGVTITVRLVPPDVELAHTVAASEAPSWSRRAAKLLVEEVATALKKVCAERGPWKGRRACAHATTGGGVRVRVASERTLAIEGVERSEAEALATLVAALPEALWVEPQPVYMPMNAFGTILTQVGSTPPQGGTGSTPNEVCGAGENPFACGTPIHAEPPAGLGLQGQGEIIGVGDSGLDVGSCFFEEAKGNGQQGQTFGPNHRKVVNYRAYADQTAGATLQDHGTHVIGSILGDPSGGNENTPNAMGGRGTAYKAKVSFTDIGRGDAPGLSVPQDLVNDFFNIDYDQGARLHSNSWGANVNAYTLPTQDVDEFMYLYDDMLILYAAGNSGQQGPGSIGAPATCKNCLTVGASENPPTRTDGNVAIFSSQGPATPSTNNLNVNNAGGRWKPDVVAPGFSVESASSNNPTECGVTTLAGTSMATPLTAGDVALIRQYFRWGYFPSGSGGENSPNARTPSGALMKAMVIHSGVPMGGTYASAPGGPAQLNQQTPSNYQGFGRVQLNTVLFPPKSAATNQKGPGERLFFVDDSSRPIGAGEEHTYTLAASGSPDPLLGSNVKVSLVWTDPPAQPIAVTPLINNLDLEVTIGGGAVCLGNNDCGALGQAADTTNTVEQVTTQVDTANPGASLITVTVRGTAVPQGPQKYALVVTGPLNIESPPPQPSPPRPPRPPRAPNDTSANAVAVGVAIPLLLFAAGAGGIFLCRKKGGTAGTYGGAAGGGGTSTGGGLPAGWKELKDAQSGAPYYLNSATGAVQWDKPAGGGGGGGGGGVKPPWQEVDDGTGRKYYHNPQTGATQWAPP